MGKKLMPRQCLQCEAEWSVEPVILDWLDHGLDGLIPYCHNHRTYMCPHSDPEYPGEYCGAETAPGKDRCYQHIEDPRAFGQPSDLL